jgi:hypothetical protein
MLDYQSDNFVAVMVSPQPYHSQPQYKFYPHSCCDQRNYPEIGVDERYFAFVVGSGLPHN